MLDMMGSDMLREYRDAILRVLASRNNHVAYDNVVRDNVLIKVLQRTPEPRFVEVQELVLHRSDLAVTGCSIPNVEPQTIVEARWL